MVSFEIVSLAGNTLLKLDVARKTTVGRLKAIVTECLPDRGLVSAFVLKDTLLRTDLCLNCAGLDSCCVLQVVFGLGPSTFWFETTEVVEGLSDRHVVASVQVSFRESLVDAHTRISSTKGVQRVSQLLLASDMHELLYEDLRGEFADFDISRCHEPFTYSLALEENPYVAEFLDQLLNNADEILLFRYQHYEDYHPGSFGNGTELLVDGLTRISCFHACTIVR